MTEFAEKSKEQVIVQASTVIVFRNCSAGLPEILMVQRSKDLSFAGAASVFPGGKVCEADTRLASAKCADNAPARIAAIREVLEETGLVIGINERASAEDARAARAMLASNEDMAPVLERFGWTLAIDTLIPFAHWLPTFKPGRICRAPK